MRALEGRTEGWIAALQLAALSLQGRDDASAFIAGFAGDDRYIVDYLAEEVLSRQPAEVRDFLLETVDPRAPHWPALRRGHRARRRQGDAVALERANLFLVPLDDQRQWYRYHHLFADVLRAHLLTSERPDEVAELHRRASVWFEAHDDMLPAISHALAGGDTGRAADLMELAMPANAPRTPRSRSGPLDARPARRPGPGPVRSSPSPLSAPWPKAAKFDTVAERLDQVEALRPLGRRHLAGAATGECRRRRPRPLPLAACPCRDVPGCPGAGDR